MPDGPIASAFQEAVAGYIAAFHHALEQAVRDAQVDGTCGVLVVIGPEPGVFTVRLSDEVPFGQIYEIQAQPFAIGAADAMG